MYGIQYTFSYVHTLFSIIIIQKKMYVRMKNKISRDHTLFLTNKKILQSDKIKRNLYFLYFETKTKYNIFLTFVSIL